MFDLRRYVKEGDEVEEFTKLCQVQSDKVSL
jgi:pyruvate/2-oxoglutarate dehydrogenase complex dihydrolipoamide acyltransferase (E2) component